MRCARKSILKIVVLLLLGSTFSMACIDTKAKERIELTETYGQEIENTYRQYMLIRLKACQTKDIQDLADFAEGPYLELLKKRVESSECYPTELIYEEIEKVTVNSYSSNELEALIRVRANGKQYYWLCKFHNDNGTWKITTKGNPPWS